MRILIVALCLVGFCGCYTIRSQSIGVPPAREGTRVEAEDSGLGFVMLTVPELSVRDEISGRCRKGTLGSVETTLAVRNFFIVQLWTLHAEGDCVREK